MSTSKCGESVSPSLRWDRSVYPDRRSLMERPPERSITNTATVNYTVSSVVQTPITAATSFLVDTYVKFTLTGGVQVDVASGQPNGAQMYTLTNTSNATSQFTLTPSNLTGDDFDMNAAGFTANGRCKRVRGYQRRRPLHAGYRSSGHGERLARGRRFGDVFPRGRHAACRDQRPDRAGPDAGRRPSTRQPASRG